MNIYVIGMPGSGKSTIAKELANELNRPFIDLDALIEKKAHMFIDDIFERYGEEYFRTFETETLKTLEETRGVIACGGGIVMVKDNKTHMKGFVVCLDADLETIRTRLKHGYIRPLLRTQALETLHDDRFLKYRDFADAMVSNDHEPKQAVDAIKRLLKERNIT